MFHDMHSSLYNLTIILLGLIVNKALQKIFGYLSASAYCTKRKAYVLFFRGANYSHEHEDGVCYVLHVPPNSRIYPPLKSHTGLLTTIFADLQLYFK